MYLIRGSDSSKYKKAKVVNKNFAVKISHNGYRDVLLNKKCLRHLMNRIQSKETYEISNISLSCFDEKKLYS